MRFGSGMTDVTKFYYQEMRFISYGFNGGQMDILIDVLLFSLIPLAICIALNLSE